MRMVELSQKRKLEERKMAFWQVLVIIAITVIVGEFGIHVIYHAVTGKAGIEDDAFSYLGDIYDAAKKAGKERIKTAVTVIERVA